MRMFFLFFYIKILDFFEKVSYNEIMREVCVLAAEASENAYITAFPKSHRMGEYI